MKNVFSNLLALAKKFTHFVLAMGENTEGLAQIGHFFAGVICADWFSWQGCLVFFGGWVTPKEAVLDPRPPENAPFWPTGVWYGPSGARDMFFYTLGMVVGLVRRSILHEL